MVLLLAVVVAAQPTVKHSTVSSSHSAVIIKRQPSPHSATISKTKPLISVRSSVTASSGNISIVANLGPVISQPFTGEITGAQASTFSTLSWVRLHPESLPQGCELRMISAPGKPEIPTLLVTVAIPASASGFRTNVKGNATQRFTNTYLPPGVKRNGDTVRRIFDRSIYEQPSTSRIIVTKPLRFRRLRFITVQIPLAEYSNGTVTVKTAFDCALSFSVSGAQMANSRDAGDPVFNASYRSLVANAGDIAAFLAPFSRKQRPSPIQFSFSGVKTFDTTVTGWIDPAASSIKMLVTRTGLYKADIGELISRSANQQLGSAKASQVRLINRGKEVPLWVDSNVDGTIRSIEFYGQRLPGLPDEFYNWDSDSNAYWLVLSSNRFTGPPIRYKDATPGIVASTDIAEGTFHIHHEHDFFYYDGDPAVDESATKQRYLKVDGERFIWRQLHDSASSVLDTFYLGALPSVITGKRARLRAFVRGASSDANDIIHTTAVIVNGTEVGHRDYKNFDSAFIDIDVPLSLLHPGANYVTFPYRGTSAGDQWYIDYYELSLPTSLTPSIDTGVAQGQWLYKIASTGGNGYTATLTGDVAPTALFDLTDTIRTLSSSSTGTSYSFKLPARGDSVTIAAASAQSYLHPDRIVDVSGNWAEILDTLAGADYIIITHPLFLSTSQKLAARRAASGLRTKVITTEQIYNAFNFGSDEPWALRRFLQYAYDYYHGVPPAFVTLMGDGTWDPKFNLKNDLRNKDQGEWTTHRSFVPTYGVPSSDFIFTLLEGSSIADSLFPEMVISRIPIESSEEAEGYLSKIVEYESAPPADWNRNFLFISGGTPPFENFTIAGYVDAFIGTTVPNHTQYGGLGYDPLFVRPTKIRRTDLTSSLDATHVAEIQSAFQQGQSLVYFFGHGAPFVTDVLFPDVSTLRNQGLYPVLITISCRTGAFAEPNIISLNESYLRSPNKGAILALGTTGFDGIDYSFLASAEIFKMLRIDTSVARIPFTGPHLINLPTVFTLGKYKESVINKTGGLQFEDDNSLYEITTLGDAALGFAFRPQPEFNVTAGDITLSTSAGQPRSVFLVSDSTIHIQATLHNFGYATSNKVLVSITDESASGSRSVIDTLDHFDTTAVLTATLRLDSSMSGSHTLRIKIDPLNNYAETNENDNEASVTFLVSRATAIAFYPPEGAKNMCDITADSVRLMMIVPSTSDPLTLEIEVDTTSLFTHPTALGSFQIAPLFFERSFSRSLFPPSSSGVIWWRTRTSSSSSGISDWALSSFSLITTGGRSEFSYSTPDQFKRTIVSGLGADAIHNGLFMSAFDSILYDITSHGSNDTNIIDHIALSQIVINGVPKYTTPAYIINGVVVATLTPDGRNIDTNNFYLFPNTGDYSDSMTTVLVDSFEAVINSIPQGRHVIVFTNFQPFITGPTTIYSGFTYNPRVQASLKLLGSAHGFVSGGTSDSLFYFGSYVLSGVKGAPSGSAKEKFNYPNNGGVQLLDTVVLPSKKGIAEFPLTPVASGYGFLKWKATGLSSDARLRLRVIGVEKVSGRIDTVDTYDASAASQIDLSSISASLVNKLGVIAYFDRDTSAGAVLSSLELEYDLAPEFEIVPQQVAITPSSVEEGKPAVLSYQCTNRTCIDGSKVPVVVLRNFNGKIDTVATHTIDLFKGHSSISFVDTISTFGLIGKAEYIISINADKAINEQIAFNNTASATLTISGDTTKPRLDLIFDGHHINKGDYVSSKVEIEIRLSDSSPIRTSDTASIGGTLIAIDPSSTTPIFFSGNQPQSGFQIQFIALANGTLQAKLTIDPTTPLKPGTYAFTAYAKDASGNKSDTIETEFVVSGKNGLDHVMNYPNPFKDKTFITFILKGAGDASVKVPIYTVAGRKIRTLTLDPAKQRVGLNAIEWDGRDENGNDIGNGTYLYKVVLTGTNEDGTEVSEAVLERAVRSR